MIFDKIKNLTTSVKVRENTGNSLNIIDNFMISLIQQNGFGSQIMAVFGEDTIGMHVKMIQEPLVSK